MTMRLLLPSALLLAATPLLAQRLPEAEPNDTAATAQAVAMGTQIDASLTAGDQDWFQFTSTGGQVRVYVSALGSGTTDTQLEILDASGAAVLAFNDDSRGLMSDITINLAAGVYLAKVNGFSATTAGTYFLDIGELATKPFTAVEVEPNDGVATAQVVADGAQIDGSLSGPTDEDWYAVTLATRSGLWFQITEGDTPWVSQHRYEVRDSAGVLLATATYGSPNAADSGSFTYRSGSLRVWPSGTYHIVVKNRSTAPAINPNPVGRYRFELIVTPMNVGASVPEAAEPNNTVATATPINPGDQGAGNITNTTGGDSSDWWGPITLTQPSYMVFQTAQGTPSPIQDTTINIRAYDPATGALGPPSAVTAGNLLDPTSHARGQFVFNLTPNTYYLEVLSPGAAASQAGDYLLEIGLVAPNPYVAASYAFGTVNASCLGTNAQRPTITVDNTRELPVLGTTFSRKAGSMPPGTPFFLMRGFSNTFANGGVTPLPYDLAPLGAPNCMIHVDPLVSLLAFADANGEFVLNDRITNILALRGALIYEQVAALDTSANALGMTISNWARLIHGERSY